MSGLQVVKVELGVKVAVPISALQKLLPAPIDKLGSQLADEVDKRSTMNGLGYYPALDYFTNSDDFPGYLLDAVDKSPVIGAAIQASNMYTVSDDMGYFNLANVYQAQQVTIHMLGYKNFEFKAKSAVADQPCQPRR